MKATKEIYKQYYEACRKYHFNFKIEGREDQVNYFNGQRQILRQIFNPNWEDKQFEIEDQKAEKQAELDFKYFTC